MLGYLITHMKISNVLLFINTYSSRSKPMVHAYKYVMFHDINIEVFHLKFFQIPYSFNYYSRYLIGSTFPSFDILSDI